MKFLVILICLAVNYLWLKDLDRFDDGWFFRFRCRVEDLTSGLVEKMSFGWLAGIILIYAIPLAALALILFITGDSVFGLMTMMVHILVLLIAFDRTQPGKLANDFLQQWKEGNMDACVAYLRQELTATAMPDARDKKAIAEYFGKQLTYRNFEKIFVMFFWYMLAGALGILFCYISCQMRDSHREQQLPSQVRLINFLVQLLEWVPVRLLALTFSLAGNFVQCFENIRNSFWAFDTDSDNVELLYSCASCAISGMVETGNSDSETETETDENAQAVDREVEKIQALLGLFERSQVIWLSALALITIVAL